MTIPGMTTGDQDAIHPGTKGLEDEQRVYPAGTGKAQDAYVRGISNPGRAGKVCPGVAAPAAEKGQDSWLPIFFFLLHSWFGFHEYLSKAIDVSQNGRRVQGVGYRVFGVRPHALRLTFLLL
jgi:hypothetical protein